MGVKAICAAVDAMQVGPCGGGGRAGDGNGSPTSSKVTREMGCTLRSGASTGVLWAVAGALVHRLALPPPFVCKKHMVRAEAGAHAHTHAQRSVTTAGSEGA